MAAQEIQDDEAPNALAQESEGEEVRESMATGKLDAAMPDFTGMTLGQAVRAARRAGVDLAPEGSGIATAQSPKPGPVARGTLCRVSFKRGG
jgi:beta-lactam-binding protein with PASTA domain